MKRISFLNDEDLKKVEGMYNLSIKQFMRDGKYTIPTAVLVGEDGKMNIIAGIDGFSDRDYGYSKNAFADQVRKIARQTNARLSMFFSEVWTKSVAKESADAQRGKSLANDPESKEAMLMLVEARGRKYANCITPFGRDADGKPVMEEMQIQEADYVMGRFTNLLPA